MAIILDIKKTSNQNNETEIIVIEKILPTNNLK